MRKNAAYLAIEYMKQSCKINGFIYLIGSGV